MLAIRFAWPLALYVLIPLVSMLAWLRIKLHRQPRYKHALGSQIRAGGFASAHPYKTIFFCMRLLTLFTLACLIGMPQLVDHQSKVQLEGIDIVLALDASGSMQFQNSTDDNRSRFEVAKQEAIRFVEKRDNDALALVLFGGDALSRTPLTPDRRMVRQMIEEVELGELVNPEGTHLFSAMVTAANRLKYSKAKSKVMILLTDGAPMNDPIDLHAALTVVKELGIRVYTIGVGDDGRDGYVMHPFYGRVPREMVPELVLNSKLLQHISQETGGTFFMARDAKDMRRIYDTIDELERSAREVPLFTRYHDMFAPFATALAGMLATELALSTFIWFAL